MPQGRILCVTSNFPRWAGDWTTPFVLHLAQDLQLLGWEVHVLAPHAPGAARRETIGGVLVERFRYLWPVRQQTVCYQGGALINLRKHPTNWLKLPALVAAEILAVARRLQTGHYDLIHSHWILPQGFTAMLARRAKPVPHVLTVHGGDIFGLEGRSLAQFKRAALHDADAVTVNSSVTEAAVKAVSGSMRGLVKIPMGVSVEPLDGRQTALAERLRQAHRGPEGPMLVFIGRVVEEKGIEDLLRATQLLAERAPGRRTLIVGEGQDRADMEQLARTLGIAEITHFAGWVDPADVPAYLHAADVFVGPSR
ncbi:MAG: glycosyltransferase, partial [Thiohalocapsa sp.]